MRTRPHEWLNAKTHGVMYGVQVHCQGEWMNVSNNGKPCIFDTPEERDALRRELQKLKTPALAREGGD